MLRTLCLALVVLAGSSCFDQPHGQQVSVRPKNGAPYGNGGYLAGGARGVLLVEDYGRPLPNVKVESSDPSILTVSSPSSAAGEVTMLTGKAGSVTLSITVGNAVHTQLLGVVEPAGLMRVWGVQASSAVVGPDQVVSLGVAGKSDSGSELYGTGLITFSLEGTLAAADGGTALDGEERVSFTGTPGQGKVRATLGALSFEYPITVPPSQGVGITLSPSNSKNTDCFPDGGCMPSLRQRMDVMVTAYGGQCVWTSDAVVEIEDHTLLDRLEAQGRYADIRIPATGSVTVTCTIGAASGSFKLR